MAVGKELEPFQRRSLAALGQAWCLKKILQPVDLCPWQLPSRSRLKEWRWILVFHWYMLSKLPIQNPLTRLLISLTQLDVGQMLWVSLVLHQSITKIVGQYSRGYTLVLVDSGCADSRWTAGKVLAQNKGGNRLVNECSVSSRLRTWWVLTSRCQVCMAFSTYTVSGTSHYCDWVRVRDRVGGHLTCSPLPFPLEQSPDDILNVFN